MDRTKLQVSPESHRRSHASVRNVINGLKARKMNVTTRPRYRVEMALYASFVMYNSSGNTCQGHHIDLLNATMEISNFDFDVREASDKDFDNCAGWTTTKDLHMVKSPWSH